MPDMTCHSSLAEHHSDILPIACYLPRKFLTFTMYLLVNISAGLLYRCYALASIQIVPDKRPMRPV